MGWTAPRRRRGARARGARWSRSSGSRPQWSAGVDGDGLPAGRSVDVAGAGAGGGGVAPEGFSGELAEAYRHIHPDDVPRVAADVEAALASTGAYTTEYRVPLPDGRTRHIAARGQMITDAAGHPLRLVGAAHDVTAERESSERIRAALESLAIGYLAMGADWRVGYVNARAERLTGRSRDELLGRSLREAFPATVGTVFEERYRQAVRSGEAVTFEAHYPGEPDIWVEVQAVPENGGGPPPLPPP